jgi:hypothetical protein
MEHQAAMAILPLAKPQHLGPFLPPPWDDRPRDQGQQGLEREGTTRVATQNFLHPLCPPNKHGHTNIATLLFTRLT